MSSKTRENIKFHWPRYFKAAQSRCIYTNHWHLYLFVKRPCAFGIQTGLSVKHRLGSNKWRHTSLKKMKYKSHERGCGQVYHFELVRHLSTDWKGQRIRGSKRYLRFKVCL